MPSCPPKCPFTDFLSSCHHVSLSCLKTSCKNRDIVGNYHGHDVLGYGSSGKVQKVTHWWTGQQFAIKIISKEGEKNEAHQSLHKLKERVWREICSSYLLEHPNIVSLYHIRQSINNYYLFFESVEGTCLYELLVDRGRMKESTARKVFRQIVSAVDYCHQNHIVHRDIKAENVLIDEHYNVKLIDFGFARLWSQSRLMETSCGSPHYASPEIVSNRTYCGPEVDIWSLGVLLYVIVCGAHPFNASSYGNLFAQINQGHLKFQIKLSKELVDLIRQMLRPNPAERATMDFVLSHPWTNKGYITNPRTMSPNHVSFYDADPEIKDYAFRMMSTYNFAEGPPRLPKDYKRRVEAFFHQQRANDLLSSFNFTPPSDSRLQTPSNSSNNIIPQNEISASSDSSDIQKEDPKTECANAEDISLFQLTVRKLYLEYHRHQRGLHHLCHTMEIWGLPSEENSRFSSVSPHAMTPSSSSPASLGNDELKSRPHCNCISYADTLQGDSRQSPHIPRNIRTDKQITGSTFLNYKPGAASPKPRSIKKLNELLTVNGTHYDVDVLRHKLIKVFSLHSTDVTMREKQRFLVTAEYAKPLTNPSFSVKEWTFPIRSPQPVVTTTSIHSNAPIFSSDSTLPADTQHNGVVQASPPHPAKLSLLKKMSQRNFFSNFSLLVPTHSVDPAPAPIPPKTDSHSPFTVPQTNQKLFEASLKDKKTGSSKQNDISKADSWMDPFGNNDVEEGKEELNMYACPSNCQFYVEIVKLPFIQKYGLHVQLIKGDPIYFKLLRKSLLNILS